MNKNPEQSNPRKNPEHSARIRQPANFADDLWLAERARTDISREVAQQIASLIAPSRRSALARFAHGEPLKNADLRAEYLEILDAPDLPAEVHDWIHWLGSHLIHAENPQPQRKDRTLPVPRLDQILWRTWLFHDQDETRQGAQGYVRGTASPEEIAAVEQQIRDLVTSYGDPFLAFLSMNDVDALAPNLEETFNDFFEGTYESREDLLYAMTELQEVEEAIRGFQDRIGGEAVYIDYDEIWERLQDAYTIVPMRGSFYVFTK
ncbi:hypothetical protein BIU82_00250 [Arthrobacter sp. SW1]|uniref:hypothetical protein n=1 Tax=Arthrobacter sp. SW1 TaxID=1920889 RepID=UPI000877DB75|nr:hypothetical protein [Arthrobacter sp. SW1]OFI39548.1 hypothetical protein BIU82_00250 [Arthrobacter sp. SW1]